MRKQLIEGSSANRARNEADDLTSSFRVIAPPGRPTVETPVCFYEHTNFKGRAVCAPRGNVRVGSDIEDIASSVRILSGHPIELYEHPDMGGTRISITGDEADLPARGFNDKLSVYTDSRCASDCGTTADVLSVAVRNAGGATPAKGDTLRMELEVRNTGPRRSTITLSPQISSNRFSDFSRVNIGTAQITLEAGATGRASFTFGPIIEDNATGKTYALGSGDYRVDQVTISTGNGNVPDTAFNNNAFALQTSNAVLNLAVYDQDILPRVGARTAEDYLIRAFTRPSEVFTPNSPGASEGQYEYFDGGFDAMMGVRHIFATFPGLNVNNQSGICEQAARVGKEKIGLPQDFYAPGPATSAGNHGFDYLITLPSNLGGGAACGWLGVQFSGLGDTLDRSQVILVHESGHIFGAPHCDPIQGYVMCSGEKHPHYQDPSKRRFVWLKDSRDQMRANRFN